MNNSVSWLKPFCLVLVRRCAVCECDDDGSYVLKVVARVTDDENVLEVYDGTISSGLVMPIGDAYAIERRDVLRFHFGDADYRDPVNIGDIVVVREVLESDCFSFVPAVVCQFIGDSGVECTLSSSLENVVLQRGWEDFVVLANADTLGSLAAIEQDERSSFAVTNDVLCPTNRDDFGRQIADVERSIAADEILYATLAPYDANGQPVRVAMAARATNDDFWAWLAEQRWASLSSVADMHFVWFNDSAGRRVERSRLLHQLYLHGAVLVCVGVLSASDLNDFGKSAEWFVCGRDDGHECSLAIALDLHKSAHLARMNLCIAKRLLAPVLKVAFDFGVMKNLDRTMGQLQVLLLASNAQEIVRDMGWQQERLDRLLSILYDIFWCLRPDLSVVDDASLSVAALCLFEPVRRRMYERKSDVAIEPLKRYYLGDADVLTESNRRSTTQRLSNNHSSFEGARLAVFEATGVCLSRSTISRLLAPRRIDSIEARRHRVELDIRSLMPRKGDIDDKLNAHYVLAEIRILREMSGNLLNRIDTKRLPNTFKALIISRDDKSRIFTKGGAPTAQPYRQMHLVARDGDGHVLPPAASLPTTDFGQVAQDSVICHTMLCHTTERGGPVRYLLRHGSIATTPVTHLVETMFHVLKWPQLWLREGVAARCVVLITDRGPQENMARAAVRLCARMLMHVLGLERLILAAYHSSNYNDSERPHVVVNRCLGSLPIGKQLTRDADVVEVARRLQGATYSNMPALVGCLLDNTEPLVPADFDEFVSLYKANATAHEKKRRLEFAPRSIEFPESWRRARQQLGIQKELANMTYGELVSLVENKALNVASEYLVDMIAPTTTRTTTISTQQQRQCKLMFPIPASSIINFGNLSSTVQATIQQTNGYLCAGDSYELLQATGVMVACPDGATLPFRDAVSTPDLFLPTKIVADAVASGRAAETVVASTLCTLDDVHKEFAATAQMKQNRVRGVEKAAATRRRNKTKD